MFWFNKFVADSTTVKFIKSLGKGVLTKFNIAILAIAGVFLALGNTAPAEVAQPAELKPGEVIELKQADLVITAPQLKDGKYTFELTLVSTGKHAFTDYRNLITVTSDGEALPPEQVEVTTTDLDYRVNIASPGIPTKLNVAFPQQPNMELTINSMTFRESKLDATYRWFDATPAARMELA